MRAALVGWLLGLGPVAWTAEPVPSPPERPRLERRGIVQAPAALREAAVRRGNATHPREAGA